MHRTHKDIRILIDDDGYGHMLIDGVKHITTIPDVNIIAGRIEAEIWVGSSENSYDSGLIAVWPIDNPDADSIADMVFDWDYCDVYGESE